MLDESNNAPDIDAALIAKGNAIDSEFQTPAAGSAGGQPETGGAQAASPVPVDYVAEARDLGEFAFGSLVPLYPGLEAVYTSDVRERIYAAAARVLEKYNVRIGDLFGRFEPEIRLAIVVVPLVPATIRAIRAQPAAAAAPGAPEPVPPGSPLADFPLKPPQ